MAVPQMSGFHLAPFTSQFAPPPPPPPTAVPVSLEEADPDALQPYREDPCHPSYPCAPATDGDSNQQPLDLRVPRGLLLSADAHKRTGNGGEGGGGGCREGSAKRPRLVREGEEEEEVAAVSNPGFPPSRLENGSREDACSLGYYAPRNNYPSLPCCAASSDRPNFSSSAPVSSQSFPSPSHVSVTDVLAEVRPPYYDQPGQQGPAPHPFYGPQASAGGSGSCDPKQQQESCGSSLGVGLGLGLGLPIPHNSVFTRSVSPLFQQSWHPAAPMAVSSHSHHALLHTAAASSVLSHFHPDVFGQAPPPPPPPPPVSLPPPLSSAGGVSVSVPAPSAALPTFSHHNAFPSSSPQSLFPSTQQSLLSSSPQQNLVPSPQQNLVPSPQQHLVPSSQQHLIPSSQQSILTSSPASVSLDIARTTLSAGPEAAFPTQQGLLPAVPHAPQQGSAQSSQASPRPFYRPFEDTPPRLPPHTSPPVLTPGDSLALGKQDCRGSAGDGPGSPSLLTLPSPSAAVCSSSLTCPQSYTDPQQPPKTQDRGAGSAAPSRDEAKEKRHEVPQWSARAPNPSGLPGHNMDISTKEISASFGSTRKSSPPAKSPEAECPSSSSQPVHAKAKTTTNPIQDNAVLSSTSGTVEPPLHNSAVKARGWKGERQPFKVIGTTSLAKVREERARQEAKARQERLRQFMAQRQHYQHTLAAGVDSSDREASPKACTDTAAGELMLPPPRGVGSCRSEERAKLPPGGMKTDTDEREASPSTSEEPETPSSSQREAGSQVSQDCRGGKRACSQTGGDSLGVDEGAPSEPQVDSVTPTPVEPGSDDVDGMARAPREPGDGEDDPSPGGSSSRTDGAPIPPDPNLKMSPLDYLISKVLVERIDVPFKPENPEIRAIYTGAKKGRLSLVDLIELQVEASLKA